MKYISLCSGVEAATLAFEPLGWEPVAFAEIDEFPSALLAARYPDVPNLGDFTKVDWSKYRGSADLVIGGFPCFPADTLVLTDAGLVPIQDIKIGDMVLTTNNKIGEVIAIKSYAYLNDKIAKKSQKMGGLDEDLV